MTAERAASLPSWLDGIEIEFGTVAPLASPQSSGVLWEASADALRVEVPEVGTYLSEAGRRLRVEPARDAPPERVAAMTVAAPLAGLMYQRGRLALHAAVVGTAAGCVVICGGAAAGKSTLAAALVQRGWFALADDIAPLWLDPDGRPMVGPVPQQRLRLWPDGRRRVGLAPENGDSGPVVPSPVRAILQLRLSNDTEVHTERLSGTDLFATLTDSLYCRPVASALLDRGAMLSSFMRVADVAGCAWAHRPRSGWSTEQIADIVETELAPEVAHAATRRHYSVYGVTCELPFACPPLEPALSNAATDVVVKHGRIGDPPSPTVASGPDWEAGEDWVVLGAPGARWLIEDGRRVTVEQAPESTVAQLRVTFEHHVLAAVVRARGLLPLHASAAATPGGAVVICGESGAGKSSVTAELLRRGCGMISDDLTVVANQAGQAVALHGSSLLCLTPESTSRYGGDHVAVLDPDARLVKPELITDGPEVPDATAVRGVYLLTRSDDGPGKPVRILQGVEKFQALQSAIFLPTPADRADSLARLRGLLEVPVFHKQRGTSEWAVEEIVSHILGEA